MPNSWSLNWEALQRGRGVTGKMSDHSIYLRVSGVYVPVAIITSPGLFVAFPLCLELLCCFTESFLTFLLGYLLPPRLLLALLLITRLLIVILLVACILIVIRLWQSR